MAGKKDVSRIKCKYKIRGRLTGHIYAKTRTLREARAKRKKMIRTQWIDEANLEIIGPMDRVVL
jgi:hypothetical protein